MNDTITAREPTHGLKFILGNFSGQKNIIKINMKNFTNAKESYPVVDFDKFWICLYLHMQKPFAKNMHKQFTLKMIHSQSNMQTQDYVVVVTDAH